MIDKKSVIKTCKTKQLYDVNDSEKIENLLVVYLTKLED